MKKIIIILVISAFFILLATGCADYRQRGYLVDKKYDGNEYTLSVVWCHTRAKLSDYVEKDTYIVDKSTFDDYEIGEMTYIPYGFKLKNSERLNSC